MGKDQSKIVKPFSIVVPEDDVTFEEPCVRCNYCGRMVKRGLVSTSRHLTFECPEHPVMIMNGGNVRIGRMKELWASG